MPEQLFIAAVFGLFISVASYYAKFLTASGSIATFVLAFVMYGFGGWQWTVPIFTFFLFSSLLSNYGKNRKARFDLVFEKSSRRDAGQVLANGGIAGVLVLFSHLFPEYEFYPLYLGAIAAVTADTWGTEIGVLTQGNTVFVLSLRPVPPGTSGGVSSAGFLGGATGALVIAFSGYHWFSDLRTLFAVIVAGVIGSLADSILGATVQAQYKCRVCGKVTERKIHCGQETERVRGLRWVTNDLVNYACAVVGCVIAWVLTTF